MGISGFWKAHLAFCLLTLGGPGLSLETARAAATRKWTPPPCFANPASFCDGVRNCADGSDEWPATCNSTFDCAQTSRIACPGKMSQKRCIDPSLLCDGKKDCPGGGDENATMCAKFKCDTFISNIMPCPRKNGRNVGYCALESNICNGVATCPQDSDESPSLCKNYNCAATGRVQCPSGVGCMDSDTALCNGKRDCRDGSDELPSTCNKTLSCVSEVKCPKRNQCLLDRTQLCDGVPDCLDGSDEDLKFCAKFNCEDVEKVRCPGHKNRSRNACVKSIHLCNGIPQCPNATDEDPAFCASYRCSDDRVKCPGTGLCIEGGIDDICDGVADCPLSVWKNGVPPDENPAFCLKHKCSDWEVKCTDKLQCVSRWAQCDGYPHCSDGSDESRSLCNSKFNCTATARVSCPSGKGCMLDLCRICDGHKDCGDGSDELPRYCSRKKCT